MFKKLIKNSVNGLGYEFKKIEKSKISLDNNYVNTFASGDCEDIIDTNDDVKIYVFFHKKNNLINSEYYHNVGLGGFGEGMCSNDAQNFDNISNKNKHYCELTGIYHIWRNSEKPPILGTAHYRRYLNVLPLSSVNSNGYLNLNWDQASRILNHPNQKNRVNKLLKEYDIIVPKSFFLNEGLAKHYQDVHANVGWPEFLRELDRLYGPSAHCLRNDKRAFWGNIFISKRDLFDEYCDQLFSVIDSVYSSVGVPIEIRGARYQPYRYPGYLAERFLTAFINSNRLRYYEADLLQISD